MINKNIKDQYKVASKLYDKIIEPMISTLKNIGLKMYPVNKNTIVLDIGCGTGSLLSIYQNYTSKIFGIDLSPSMIRIARKKLGQKANIILGSATKTEFKTNYFNLITCSLILHELSESVRIEILKEAKRILKNDGKILLIDYHPSPIKKFKGFYTKIIIIIIEFLAGREHYKNYNQFIKNGGVPNLIQKLGLKIENQKILWRGNCGIFILSKINNEIL